MTSTGLRGGLLLASALAVTLLAGCSASPPPPAVKEVEVSEGVTYWSDGTSTLLADVCEPAEESADPLPVILLLHGGGFTDGDREGGGMRAVCTLVARSGFVGVSIDYRLGPEFAYPSQEQDVEHAIEWLRSDEQVADLNIDPARVGLFGSSAGAILTEAVATKGEGDLTTGTRVKAAVALSGVPLFTTDALSIGVPSPAAVALVLNYLGCTTVDADSCPQAEEASALLRVDASDPPMFLVNGTDELVPLGQAQLLKDALDEVGVPAELVTSTGDKHGIQLLSPSTRTKILEFFEKEL